MIVLYYIILLIYFNKYLKTVFFNVNDIKYKNLGQNDSHFSFSRRNRQISTKCFIFTNDYYIKKTHSRIVEQWNSLNLIRYKITKKKKDGEM